MHSVAQLFDVRLVFMQLHRFKLVKELGLQLSRKVKFLYD